MSRLDSIKYFFLVMAFIAWVLLFGGLSGAEEGREELVIMGEQGLEIQANHLRQIYPQIRANLEDAFSWKLLSAPKVVLVADQEIFEKMSGNPLISAFALPSQQTIVFRLPSATSQPYIWHETFEHELCHLLLHDHIRAALLPRWLDEGICQWVSGSLGEILVGKGVAASEVNFLLRPIPLNQLAERFPGDKDSLLQAYAESRQFVDYIVAHYGKEGLLGVLNRLKDGEEIDQAFAAVLSTSLPDLQKEWLEELHSSNAWLLWVSQYLYEIIFFVGALLTVLAFVRLMIRKKGYDPDEEDEGMEL